MRHDQSEPQPLHIALTVHEDAFELSGDIAVADVHVLLRAWLTALHQGIPPFAIRELTAQLAASTTDLAAALQESAAVVIPAFTGKRVSTMAPQVLADLTAEVADAKTVMAGASAALRGVKARIEAAVAASIANGATAEELAPLSALVTDLDTATADLTAAIITGTEAEGEEPPAV